MLRIDVSYIDKRKVTKPELRFVKFMSSVRDPITEEKIEKYYVKNVMRWGGKWDFKKGEFVWRKYSSKEKRQHSLNWFDRWAGKYLRKGIISQPLPTPPQLNEE